MSSTISCPTGGSSKHCQEAKLEQSSVQLHQEHVDYRRVASQWEGLTASGSSGFTSLKTSPGLITSTSSLKQKLSFLCRLKRLNMERGTTSISIRSITGSLIRTQQSGSAIHGGALNCRNKSRWIKTDEPSDCSSYCRLVLRARPSRRPWPPHSGTVFFNNRKIVWP